MRTSTATFASFDNSELFYREWEHEDTVWNGRVILLLHRGHEHSGRLESIASHKVFAGYKIFSYDNRGHGYTEAKTEYEFMNLVRDLDSFASYVSSKLDVGMENIFVVANSVAGVVASTWVHDFAPHIAGVALVAPAFKIKLYFPFAKEFLKLAIRFKPELNIKSYVKSKFLTHNQAEQEKYNSDTLITPNIPASQLTTLLDTAQRIVSDAHMITTPAFVISAGSDYVVDSKVQGDFYANLSSNTKKYLYLDNFYHGILYENGHEKVLEQIEEFITQCFALEPNKSTQSMIDDAIKFTQREKDHIAYGSLPLCSSISYAIQRLSMKYMGSLSDGMAIGKKYGFDSGVTLDYVYKNIPSGKGRIGKQIDKNYLNSIGWRGIRQRKANMIQAISEKIHTLKAQGKEVSILDIAGGPARYLAEVATQNREIKIKVRDYQIQNVQEGEALAKELGLENITYEQCDAFDSASYSMDERPNIIIISGIFELFSDNYLIENAIRGVSSLLSDDGYLLYTGQPWHPQLEQIANVLGNHQNQKWVMRRRGQYELDYLFSKYGFTKESMRIDDYGIFTVSSANKRTK